ncbi:hypothetical protein BHE74_00035310 [Ensete ventricosum]|uniref:Uncharacterized protein n=1 Tax=Ensete ventricosum TaxID=4639 RepID=A0A444G9D3_ENSVE|nr:hypothetical protein B296_00016103 [Ensete ventricosum]RWW31482.1 hypothetical protein GW17_00003891 [Ensete ventricosum]RWW57869.1 hypothetical protein BHE74_00035310 [Ensete ventricosum]RZS12194.1 hypothetical protein BHM03_00043609 [Ensete ventricosum]
MVRREGITGSSQFDTSTTRDSSSNVSYQKIDDPSASISGSRRRSADPRRRTSDREEAEEMSAKVASSPALANGRFFTVGLVASWYSSNIGVLLLNKYLLSNYGFKYPIFLTMCHMTACSLLSYAAIAWLKLVPMQPVRSRVQFFKISALSLVFCASVVSGNISLRYLPVSFNQAVGATTPFFTAVFAYLMTLRRESWITYITLVPVVTGVIIASGVSFLGHIRMGIVL